MAQNLYRNKFGGNKAPSRSRKLSQKWQESKETPLVDGTLYKVQESLFKRLIRKMNSEQLG